MDTREIKPSPPREASQGTSEALQEPAEAEPGPARARAEAHDILNHLKNPPVDQATEP